MANSLLTPTMITREGLRVLHNNLVFAKGVNRQYSDEFARSGAKIGSTINVRKPNKYYVRTGPAMQAQNTSETSVPLTLNRQWGVDINFSSAELTLSLDDFSKRILTPAMARIASQIDYEGLAQAFNVFNQVGTPGYTPGANQGTGMLTVNAPQIFLNAGVYMDNQSTPRDENRRIIINPAAMASSVSGLSGLFNDQGTIGEQYRKGVLGTALGFEIAMDQNVNLLTTGTHAGTPLVSGANQTGSTIVTSGWTAGSAVLNAGEVIQIAGVYSVNPENQISTGLLANFVVTSNVVADGSGNASIPIYPSITPVSATQANGTVLASPASGAAITLMSGSANTSYPINIGYHQDAFTFATADLELPKGVDFAARESYDGISMRIVRAFDITNDQFPCRIDVLGGWATLRPELACRIAG